MKTTVGVFFGGRSTEHEISVISALQAINAFNKEKYEIQHKHHQNQSFRHYNRS